jgi:hypothetical protein
MDIFSPYLQNIWKVSFIVKLVKLLIKYKISNKIKSIIYGINSLSIHFIFASIASTSIKLPSFCEPLIKSLTSLYEIKILLFLGEVCSILLKHAVFIRIAHSTHFH